MFGRVFRTLKQDRIFLFNMEHPVSKYWPVDDYYRLGKRETHFLGCDVVKHHHTLTQIPMGLMKSGFILEAVEEAEPAREMMDIPGMEHELRRPMMLLVRARG